MKRRSVYRSFRGLILFMAGISVGILCAKLKARNVPRTLTLEEAFESAALSMIFSPYNSTIRESQGDETGLVLRVLAREAGLKIVLSDQAASNGGTVTMRVVDKSPRQVIDAIVKWKGFVSVESGRVLYIKRAGEQE